MLLIKCLKLIGAKEISYDNDKYEYTPASSETMKRNPLNLNQSVTFFVRADGVGKSTLLLEIALRNDC